MAAIAVLVIVLVAAWRFLQTDPRESIWRFSRLTLDSGLTDFPALSKDGTLVAYSSDRATPGAMDLYVQRIGGGQPIRLTSDGAGNTTPDFSPDGGRIAFRSNRDGGGIYEIPTFGGEPRLLARDGLDPKYSPDGTEVAYWIGNPGSAETVPGSGAVWVVSRNGGTPRRVGTSFTAARSPIWAPDGKHLLVIGYTAAKSYQKEIDWWLVSSTGNDTVRTEAYQAFVRGGLQVGDSAVNAGSVPIPSMPDPGCWTAQDNAVRFSAESGDSNNLFEIDLPLSTRKVSGPVRRLTTGAGFEKKPSCASGSSLAFTKYEMSRDLWVQPFDLNRGVPLGKLERITEGPSRREYPSLSGDGRYLAFASSQSGLFNIWWHDLTTNKQSPVASSSFVQRYPSVSPSGRLIAFSVYEGKNRFVYVSSPNGVPEKVCEGCLRATDWSPDESKLLVYGGDPFQIEALALKTHLRTPLLKHATHSLLYGRYSPDGNWVSFTERLQPSRGRIAVAPVDAQDPTPETAWIPISEESGEDWADWSPDGQTLYFTSARDGHVCFWGQRLDLKQRRLAGPAFPLVHFHERIAYQQSNGGWSAAGGKIAFVLREDKGNIWIMSQSAKR
jgi:Tol biopolymer transport system component